MKCLRVVMEVVLRLKTKLKFFFLFFIFIFLRSCFYIYILSSSYIVQQSWCSDRSPSVRSFIYCGQLTYLMLSWLVSWSPFRLTIKRNMVWWDRLRINECCTIGIQTRRWLSEWIDLHLLIRVYPCLYSFRECALVWILRACYILYMITFQLLVSHETLFWNF